MGPKLRSERSDTHVSQPADSAPLVPAESNAPPPPVIAEGAVRFEVDGIVDSRLRRNKVEYKVEWTGYQATGDRYSWEPPENLDTAVESIDAFHRAYPKKPGPLSMIKDNKA